MASSGVYEGVTINNGDKLSVEVDEFSGDIISVKLVTEGKLFRGVLLHQVSGNNSHLGVNPDRICSAPCWPLLNNTSNAINLKTTPCSTERYSYKVEGQASNLNVFQPDPNKRSHRHQPAPQLSRILRPRRFICRKCKKAYHLEDHGAELSSDVLADSIDRRTSDSSAINSDSELNCLSSKLSMSNYSSLSNGTLQSIRHVTPPIIPKPNEEFNLDFPDTETHSVSASTTIVNPKKLMCSEHSSKVTKVSAEPKPTLLKRRKAVLNSEIQKSKRFKLCTQKDSQPNVSDTHPSSLITVTDNCSSPPAVLLPLENDIDQSCPNTKPLKLDVPTVDAQIRRNRIKAQYVSVASSFRLPLGKASLKIFGCESKEKSNIKMIQTTRRSVEGRTSATKVCKGSRSRTRNLKGSNSTLKGVVLESSTNPLAVSSNTPTPPTCAQVLDESKTSKEDSTLSESNEAAQSMLSKDKPVFSSQSSSKVAASNLHSSGQLTAISETNQSGRHKSVDYEKPKNRWIREARARRTQDEKGSLSNVQVNTVTVTGYSTSVAESTNSTILSTMPSPNLSRLWITTTDNSSKGASQTKVKATSGLCIVQGAESVCLTGTEKSITERELVDLPVSYPISINDCPPQTLPVIKIKINRTCQSSDGSKSGSLTQYEVVKPQSADVTQIEQDTVDASKDSNLGSFIESSSFKSDFSFTGVNTPSPAISASSSREITSNFEKLGTLVDYCRLSDGTEFRVGDVVWSKLSGWPYWPSRITSIQSTPLGEIESPAIESVAETKPSSTKRICYTACLDWFAWDQVSYMSCDKLYHFLEHISRFDNKKKRGSFRQAVQEAREAAMSRANIQHDESVVAEPVVKGVDNPSELSVADSLSISTEVTRCDPKPKQPITSYNKFKRSRVKHNNQKRNVTSDLSSPQLAVTHLSDRMVAQTSTPLSDCSTLKPMLSDQPLDVAIPNANDDPELRSIVRLKIKLSASKAALNSPVGHEEENKGIKSNQISMIESTSYSVMNSSEANDSDLAKDILKSDCPTDVRKSTESAPTLVDRINSPKSTVIPSHSKEVCVASSEFLPPSEILSQFPYVFPDLKASGILSDTVDIPTFSEDESEDEDSGRLIIDPDVMAAVSNSGNNHRHIFQSTFIKPEPPVLREDSLDVRHDQATVYNSNRFPVPHSRCPHTFNDDSVMAPITSKSVSTNLVAHTLSTSNFRMNNQPSTSDETINTVLMLSPQLSSLNMPPLLPANTPAYFQSSHLRAPSTTAHNAPFITTEYSNL